MSQLIFLIEPDKLLREALTCLLEPEGFKVKSFIGYDDFAASLGQEQSYPDAVLTSFSFPGKNKTERKGGTDVAKLVYDNYCGRVPCLVMSSLPYGISAADRHYFTNREAPLAKPFKLPELLAVIADGIKALRPARGQVISFPAANR